MRRLYLYTILSLIPYAALYRPVHAALRVALCHVLALIIELFALHKRKLYLHKRALQINLQRNEGKPLLLQLLRELKDLTLVH